MITIAEIFGADDSSPTGGSAELDARKQPVGFDAGDAETPADLPVDARDESLSERLRDAYAARDALVEQVDEAFEDTIAAATEEQVMTITELEDASKL